jgi:DNA-binding TFAR19-related protein (PDSD5 family)
MAEYDLELIKRRKLLELEKKLLVKKSETPPEKVDYDSIVRSRLVGRGEEVLIAAERQYPMETPKIIRALAEAIRANRIRRPIDGGALYELFLALGMRVRLETKIVYEKNGEEKSISEVLREGAD